MTIPGNKNGKVHTTNTTTEAITIHPSAAIAMMTTHLRVDRKLLKGLVSVERALVLATEELSHTSAR